MITTPELVPHYVSYWMYRDVLDVVGLQGHLDLVNLNHKYPTLVMKGSIVWRPGSVHELRMAPPRL